VEIQCARWVVSWPLFAAGGAAIVAGGLVGAATAPSPSEKGSWAAAYLVLVAGVAQIGLGFGQAALSTATLSTRILGTETIGWNAANAAVIAGTLANVDSLVDTGGILLVATLATFATRVRGGEAAFGGRRWPAYVFRGLVVVLMISIPIGLVLATVHGNR